MNENLPLEGKRISPLVKWLLFAYAFVFGVYVGGGIFETVVVTPLWGASAEAARYYNQNLHSHLQTGNFFIIIAPLTTLLSAVTLIAGWRTAQPIRFWLRLQTIVFLILFIVTLFYYAPEQNAIKGAAAQNWSDAELAARASRWVLLNWVRFFVAIVLWGMLFHALGLAYRQSGKNND